jgi:hypothetical protein
LATYERTDYVSQRTTYPHLDIQHQHSWAHPVGRKSRQIDHILIAERRLSNMTDFVTLITV